MSEINVDDAAPTMENTNELPRQKLKYDWYQTETHVTVNILIKHLNKDQVKINFEEKSFFINFCLDDSFHLNLLKPIIPDRSTYRLTPTKIELKLKKLNDDLWANLEPMHSKQQKEVAQANSKWDKLVETELKDDSAQGEAALNELFQKIYSEGSDEVKKAMNKSFLESGGTVLSTNWNEVGEKKVDIKPPDGMEWKKWDEP